MAAKERSVQYYYSAPEFAPFRNWRQGIGDKKLKAAVDARLAGFRGGNFGDSWPIGEGASECRIDYGPGYRIYYGIDGNRVLLLYGGDKSSQGADIATAVGFWKNYKERKKQERKKNVKKRVQSRPAKRSAK